MTRWGYDEDEGGDDDGDGDDDDYNDDSDGDNKYESRIKKYYKLLTEFLCRPKV